MRADKLVTLLLILFACGMAYAQTDVYSSEVEGAWTLAGSPYRVHVEVLVAETCTLNIEPGVEVLFDAACGMYLEGCLNATGTVQDSIGFGPSNETWGGIHISGTNWDADSTRIEHCVITGSNNSGITCDTAFRVSIRHNRISDNSGDYGAGIFIYGSTPLITDNLIRDNISYGNGGGIYVWENSTPLIARNTIVNNICYDSGGGIGVHNCIPLIYGNRIEGNDASYVGGGVFLFNSSAQIVNNFILNNTGQLGGGVGVWSGCPPYLAGNLICNNSASQGGGLFSYNFNGISMFNDTVCNNYADQGGGICLYSNIDVEAVNCVFWGNQAESCDEVSIGELCTPRFINCCIEDGYEGFGGYGISGYDFDLNENISITDPLFAAPSGNAGAEAHCPASGWKLTGSSPCIDSGVLTDDLYLFYYDLFGSPRISGGGIDIGAAEWQSGQSGVAEEVVPVPETVLSNYPNPFNPETTIAWTQEKDARVSLRIYNIRGELVRTLFEGVAGKGSHTLVWDGKSDNGGRVGSGFYLARLDTGSRTVSRRMVLMR
jgi:parallel beta-helix repeat protein